MRNKNDSWPVVDGRLADSVSFDVQKSTVLNIQ